MRINARSAINLAASQKSRWAALNLDTRSNLNTDLETASSLAFGLVSLRDFCEDDDGVEKTDAGLEELR